MSSPRDWLSQKIREAAAQGLAEGDALQAIREVYASRRSTHLSRYAEDQFWKGLQDQPVDPKSPTKWIAPLDVAPTLGDPAHEVSYEGYARQPSRFEVETVGDGEPVVRALDEVRFAIPDEIIIKGWAIYDQAEGGNLLVTLRKLDGIIC
jgi:hypothetical protein